MTNDQATRQRQLVMLLDWLQRGLEGKLDKGKEIQDSIHWLTC